MKKKAPILNFRLSQADRELFDWYCQFKGKKTSERLRELIEPDLKNARKALKNIDVSGNEFLIELKAKISEQDSK